MTLLVDRVGIGVSLIPDMGGSGNVWSSIVIGSPGNGSIGSYVMYNESVQGIVSDPTPGTFGMSVTFAAGTTTMTWSRKIDNGNPNDTQISTSGYTTVVYAVGNEPVFSYASQAPNGPMGAASINLVPSSSAALTSDLQLYWYLTGDDVYFTAVLKRIAWYGVVCAIRIERRISVSVQVTESCAECSTVG